MIHGERHFGDRSLRCYAERPRSLQQMVDEAVQRAPDRDALVADGKRWSWAALAERAERTAGGLHARGVRPGERVILLLGNGAPFVIATLALARLGAVAVPVSIRSAPPEVEYVAGHCGAVLVLAEDDLQGHVPPGLPCVHVSRFDALDGAAPPAPRVHEEDVATILYTSGTTGRPKGAMLSHLNIVHSAMHYEAGMALGRAERTAVAVPLSHVTGLVAQLWTMVRTAGAIVTLPAFKAGEFLRLAAAERITHTVMVPAMYNLCLLQEDVSRFDLRAWRVGAYGGAPMPPATIAALAERLPALVLQNCYGATETASPATIMPPGFNATHAASVGRAVECGELQVVDAEGRPLPPGELGEIWIRGPMVVQGYWANAEATASSITDGWWHSGDLGTLDAQGFLRVLDRLKDVINRGGYKVFSSEVEAVLAQHPAVAESAIVGYACPVLGERVHAFVALKADAGEAALRAFCAERLADYKVPERWTLQRDALPRNANGKLMKRALRERA